MSPWRRRLRVLVPCVVLAAAIVAAASAQQPPQIGIAPVTLTAGPYVFDTAEQHKIAVSVVARGLAHPFSLAFLPDGDALVTERGGRLRVVRNATGAQGRTPALDAAPIAGVPETPTFRTGGLQEVALHPKFASNRWVYFTYNKAGDPLPTPPGGRKSAITRGPRHVRRQGADRGEGRVGGRVPERRQRLAARLRSRRTAVRDDRRAVRSRGAGHQQHLRQGAAAARRWQRARRQSVRRPRRCTGPRSSRWGIAITSG